MNIGKATVLIMTITHNNGKQETVSNVLSDSFFDDVLAFSGETKQDFCNNFRIGFNNVATTQRITDMRFVEMQDAYVMDMACKDTDNEKTI